MADLGEVPFRRYYGSVDSTPLFVMLAGAYLERTGDLETVGGCGRISRRRSNWIERYGDRDGDGFVEYGRRTDKGLANRLEGQPRRDFPRRRAPGARPDRPGRGAGLCLRGLAGR